MAAGAAVPGFTRCLLPQTLSSGGFGSVHLQSLYGGVQSSRLFSASRLYLEGFKGEVMVVDCNAGHLKRCGIHCISSGIKLSTLVQNHVPLNVEDEDEDEEVEEKDRDDDEGMAEVLKEEDYTDLPWLQSMVDTQTSPQAYLQFHYPSYSYYGISSSDTDVDTH